MALPVAPTVLPKWYRRELTRAIWLVTGPIACACWLLMGFISMRRLGHVLERTGQNLQSYDW